MCQVRRKTNQVGFVVMEKQAFVVVVDIGLRFVDNGLGCFRHFRLGHGHDRVSLDGLLNQLILFHSSFKLFESLGAFFARLFWLPFGSISGNIFRRLIANFRFRAFGSFFFGFGRNFLFRMIFLLLVLVLFLLLGRPVFLQLPKKQKSSTFKKNHIPQKKIACTLF